MNIRISFYQSRVQALQLKSFWSFPCFYVPFSVFSHFRKNRIIGHQIVTPKAYLSFAFHLDLRFGLGEFRNARKILLFGPLLPRVVPLAPTHGSKTTAEKILFRHDYCSVLFARQVVVGGRGQSRQAGPL